MEHDLAKLKAHITSLSVCKDFDNARLEWKWVAIEINPLGMHCPCGQPILELCHLENLRNSEKTFVGNVCVNRFLGIDTGNTFDGLRRIINNSNANPNSDLIKHAYEMGYLFDKEFKFLNDIKRKRKLSAKQMSWKKKINERILNQTVVNRKSGDRPQTQLKSPYEVDLDDIC